MFAPPLWGTLSALLCLSSLATPALAQGAAALPPQFEAPVMRGLAISPDGLRLIAVHGDTHRVAVYDLRVPAEPQLLGEVEVGLDPVAVGMPSDGEAWVVCQGSDAVSVVDVDRLAVVASVALDDEPSDIVFAAGRAFVSSPTQRETLVLDVATRSIVARLSVFADEPRALTAVGGHVYVASYRSGNGTTILPSHAAPPPAPPTNPALPPAPQTGRIVRADDPAWVGSLPRSLPDLDVFEIDPVSLAQTRAFHGVGTILTGMAGQGSELFVANTDALNLVATEPQLRGHVVDHRLTRIDLRPAATVQPVDLNPGVDYTLLPNPGARATALASPAGVAVDPVRGEVLVSAFGSDRLGVLSTSGVVLARIEIGDVGVQGVAPRRKRGPRSVLVHSAADLAYVHNRLSSSISVVDLGARTQLREIDLPDDLTPAWFREARGFLYDTRPSGNGLTSCASCHVDGATDGLAWDLGDPGGAVERTPLPGGGFVDHHPMKGPMVTLSLQGLPGTEPFHWRGDEPDFASFNPLFATLMGGTPLGAQDLADFDRFVRTLAYPANPRQKLDGTLTTTPVGRSAADGHQFFHNDKFLLPGPLGCVDCHPGVHGAGGGIQSPLLLQTTQALESPQLRGIYKRIAAWRGVGETTSGFGLAHDGEFASPIGMAIGLASHLYDGSDRIQAYLLEFAGDVAACVGVSTLIGGARADEAESRVLWRRLVGLADAGHCDLVLRGHLDGERIGLLWDPVSALYTTDDPGLGAVDEAWLVGMLDAGRATVLVTAAPLGSGVPLAIDRDRDGVRDGAERPSSRGAATGACPVRVRANSYPILGQQDFRLVADGLMPTSTALFLVGGSPVDFQFAGLRLLVDPASAVLIQGSADARGVASAALPLPASPGLRGVTLQVQAIGASACPGDGVTGSRRLEVVLR
ncbi:MAG: hypothetical protein O3C51_12765 [Planctomycetota bacterium]|nr:hypothetical protein [Planctomycetota bacterium]MDA1222452.1 hypothetical protein [Planctomycetota bacterium]